MLFIRTIPLSLSPSWNLLHRLLLAQSRFSGGRGFRFLRFQLMDSFSSSENSRARPNLPCWGSSCGGHLHNRDHNSNVIMIGTIPVNLNYMVNKHTSVDKNDDFELRRDQKGIPANVPSSFYDVQPVSSTKRRTRIELGFERGLKSNTSSSHGDEPSVPDQFGKKNGSYFPRKHRSVDIGSKSSLVTDSLHPFEPFDICSSERRVKEKSGSYWQVKDSVKVIEHAREATNGIVLRPGMVLLKRYISLHKQVSLVKTCRELGLGQGRFYQPGYSDGAKLRLQMMCLGLDWDPQTRKYETNRVVDGNEPPEIPPEFAVLVKEALKDAHTLIKNNCNTNNVEDTLPTMSPDICIVNFYSTRGRLGLHQDRDESKESLVNGLPVVSFSLGNSAEFLYGDRRDIDEAKKIVLESGDVLIFGGESRHVFHGVSSIIPKSMPKFLLDHTGLRRGRLNLTFRKY